MNINKQFSSLDILKFRINQPLLIGCTKYERYFIDILWTGMVNFHFCYSPFCVDATKLAQLPTQSDRIKTVK